MENPQHQDPAGPPAGGGTDQAEPHPPPHDGPRVGWDDMRELGRLRRSAFDRKVAGVAGGVARHFDVDPLVVRIAFVVLVFFGGGGLLLYGAGWLLVPDERTGRATVNVDERSRTAILFVAGILAALSIVGDALGSWGFPWPLLIAALVVVAVLLGKNHTDRPHPGAPASSYPSSETPTATGPGGPHGPAYAGYRPGPAPASPRRRGPLLFWFTMTLAALAVGVVGTVDLAGADVAMATYPAAVLATCGVMLLVGAFYGRAGGLILVGLVAAVGTAFFSVADGLDFGQVDQSPTSASGVDDHYELDAGEIRIDLTDVEDLEELDGRTLDLDLQMGRIEVIVPDDGLDVVAAAEVRGAGETRMFGDESSNSDTATHGGGTDAPELTIDAEVLFGEIVVHTEAEAAAR